MAVTIQQIAKKAGVAPSTVSAALSPMCKKKISKDRINQIRKIADILGYTPNLSARSLRVGKTFNLGVVIPSFLEHYPISVYYDLISKECFAKGYRAVPLQMNRQLANIDYAVRELAERHVDALLFLDYIHGAYESYLKLWQAGNPMFFRILDPAHASVPFNGVLVDHYNSIKSLCSFIRQKWQHIILMREGSGNFNTLHHMPAMYRAWDNFLMENRKSSLCAEIAEYPERTAKCRYQAVRNLISANKIAKGKTCLLLDGGDGISGVYAALKDAGMAIGSDVAVASTHSIPANEYVDPETTCLEEPYKDIAKKMVEEVLVLINESSDEFKDDKKTIFEPKLKTAFSTGV